MGAGLFIGVFFSLTWWWLLQPLNEESTVQELEIPDGTAAAVAAGQPAPFIPDKLVLSSGGELRVRNRDVVEHRVGGFAIPAGAVAVIRPETDSNRLSCTIHPSGSLGVSPAGRPPLTSMVLPAALIGLPLGLVCWLVSMVASKLDMHGEDGPPGPAAGIG